jgi:hypothetical protein
MLLCFPGDAYEDWLKSIVPVLAFRERRGGRTEWRNYSVRSGTYPLPASLLWLGVCWSHQRSLRLGSVPRRRYWAPIARTRSRMVPVAADYTRGASSCVWKRSGVAVLPAAWMARRTASNGVGCKPASSGRAVIRTASHFSLDFIVTMTLLAPHEQVRRQGYGSVQRSEEAVTTRISQYFFLLGGNTKVICTS